MTGMSGTGPTLYQSLRQLVGRAIRETGQAIDRLGVKTISLAITKHDYYDDPVIYEDHLSRHRQLFPMLICGRPVIHQNIAYIAPCATLIGSVYVGKHSSIWYGAVLRGDTCENTVSLITKYKIEVGIDDDDTDLNNNYNNMKNDSLIEQQQQPETLQQSTTAKTTENETTSSKATTTTTSSSITSIIDKDIDISTLQDVPKPWKISETIKKDQKDHHGGAIFIGNNTNIQDAAIITSYMNHCIIGNNVTIGHCAQLHSCTIHDNVLIGMGSIINPGVVVETNSFIAAGANILENTIVPSGTLWMGNPAKMVRNLTSEQIQKITYQSSEYVQVALTHQHVMELGGNVDINTGVAVYITSSSDDVDDNDDVSRLEQQQQQQGNQKTNTDTNRSLNNSNNVNISPNSGIETESLKKLTVDTSNSR